MVLLYWIGWVVECPRVEERRKAKGENEWAARKWLSYAEDSPNRRREMTDLERSQDKQDRKRLVSRIEKVFLME
jgi:hypothetical protein